MITVKKILDAYDEVGNGNITYKVILTDGVNNKLVSIEGHPDNQVQGIADIEAREDIQEVFELGQLIKKAPNIQTPAKTFLDNLPDLEAAKTAVDNITDLASAKVIIKKIVKVLFALKDLGG